MTVAELIPAYVQAAAIVAAGLWAYWRFRAERVDEPATDIDVDVRFVGRQEGGHVVEVTAVLENKGHVRHTYHNFRMRLRYLRSGEKLVDGDTRLHHQLVFPHSIDERIGGGPRHFANAAYINPAQRFQHRYETFVPVDAAFVLVHCRFEFRETPAMRLRRLITRRVEPVYVDAQKVFWVPGGSTQEQVAPLAS